VVGVVGALRVTGSSGKGPLEDQGGLLLGPPALVSRQLAELLEGIRSERHVEWHG